MKHFLIFAIALIPLVGKSQSLRIDSCRPAKYDVNTGVNIQGNPWGPCFTGKRDTVYGHPMIEVRYCSGIGLTYPPKYFFKYKLVPDTATFFQVFLNVQGEQKE